jgi:hypothetical protein
MSENLKDKYVYKIPYYNIFEKNINIYGNYVSIDSIDDIDVIANLIVENSSYNGAISARQDFIVDFNEVFDSKKEGMPENLESPNERYLLFRYNEKRNTLTEVNTNIEFYYHDENNQDLLEDALNDVNAFVREFRLAKKYPLVIYQGEIEEVGFNEYNDILATSVKFIPILKRINGRGQVKLDRQFQKMVQVRHILAKFINYKKDEEAKKLSKISM